MNRYCIQPGCKEIAGTEYSPFWCKKHDDERLDVIDMKYEIIERSVTKKDAGWNVEVFNPPNKVIK